MIGEFVIDLINKDPFVDICEFDLCGLLFFTVIFVYV